MGSIDFSIQIDIFVFFYSFKLRIVLSQKEESLRISGASRSHWNIGTVEFNGQDTTILS